MIKSKEIALCGVFAALAVTVMCLGGLFPFMTYVCPIICISIAWVIYKLCGKLAWTWYAAVSILAFLLCPDKESAAIFTTFGYYPFIRDRIERFRLKWVIKFVYFNLFTLALYWFLINVAGMAHIGAEFSEMGAFLTAIMLVAGNVIFWSIDKILFKLNRLFNKKYKSAR